MRLWCSNMYCLKCRHNILVIFDMAEAVEMCTLQETSNTITFITCFCYLSKPRCSTYAALTWRSCLDLMQPPRKNYSNMKYLANLNISTMSHSEYCETLFDWISSTHIMRPFLWRENPINSLSTYLQQGNLNNKQMMPICFYVWDKVLTFG